LKQESPVYTHRVVHLPFPAPVSPALPPWYTRQQEQTPSSALLQPAPTTLPKHTQDLSRVFTQLPVPSEELPDTPLTVELESPMADGEKISGVPTEEDTQPRPPIIVESSNIPAEQASQVVTSEEVPDTQKNDASQISSAGASDVYASLSRA